MDKELFVEEVDHAILMHRDAHFGGNFALMLDYYAQEEGKGIQEEFSIERIITLSQIQRQSSSNLSALLLEEEEKNEIERSKTMYEALEKAYTISSSNAEKIANLILSDQEHPQKEIDEICAIGKGAIPLLLAILEKEDFYNPLFPGYGYAPIHACECLGKLEATEAIAPLFEALQKTEFFGQETIIQALHRLGSPAKDFLLHRLQKKPFHKENENAAIALLAFKEDKTVQEACFSLFEQKEAFSQKTLLSYLLFILENIPDTAGQQRLEHLRSLPIAEEIKTEISWIIKQNNKQQNLK